MAKKSQSDKRQLITQGIIEKLGLDPKKYKMYHTAWWVNPRTKTTGGFRLTENGYKAFKALEVEEFKIDLNGQIEWNSKMVLQMDHFVDAPFYLTPKTIHVFDSSMAVQLILFAGNLQKFGAARALSVAKKRQKIDTKTA
jgi:hypothetical protein